MLRLSVLFHFLSYVSIIRNLHVAEHEIYFLLPEEKKSALNRQTVVKKYESDDIVRYLKEVLSVVYNDAQKIPLFPAAYYFFVLINQLYC